MELFENNWAVVVPMANEENDFEPFVNSMKHVFDRVESGTCYFIVDKVSKDRTLELCQKCAAGDARFVAVWAPENRNLVDAYLRGFREALQRGHKLIIEMDAGLSHDPAALPMFLRVLNEGNECALGSRYMNGGSNVDSPIKRRFFSLTGTILAKVFLGAKLKDMTSGYQGFHAHVVERLLKTPLKSTAHFYQTEVRYLVRKKRIMEVPIHYRAPSPRVSHGAIKNALATLAYYTIRRITLNAPEL